MGAHETPTIQRPFDTLLPGFVVQTNQEASGWVETQEKVNTPPAPSPSSGLFNLVSSVFRPLLESVLSR